MEDHDHERLARIVEEYGLTPVVTELRDTAEQTPDRKADVELCNAVLEGLEGTAAGVSRDEYIDDHMLYDSSMDRFTRAMDDVSRVADAADRDNGYVVILGELAQHGQDLGQPEADVLSEIVDRAMDRGREPVR